MGRSGLPAGTAPLLKLLADPDADVRVAAIISLGWLQAQEAVAPLLKLAAGDDARTRRRAVQALGQIGDARAVPVLLAAIAHADFYTAENAILALGWLKAPAAVAPLLKLMTESDRKDQRQRGLMMAAVRALGHLGDATALPALEQLAAAATDYPASRKNANLPVANIYSTAQALGLKGHADLAIAEIKAGGRREVGLAQSPFLAAQDKFYGITGRFNAFAGRVSSVREMNFRDAPSLLWPYLWEAGFTGIHQAWGEQDHDPAKYLELVQTASDFDLRWIDILPAGGNMFGAKAVSSHYGPHGAEKVGAEVVLLQYQNVPAFQGFWYEETYPEVHVPGPEFEAWLRQQHGADFRQKLGVAADYDIAKTVWVSWLVKDQPPYPQALKVEYLRHAGELLLESWRESQEWLHGVRKGCAFTYSISEAQPVKYPGVPARAGGVIDANGPETYQCFGPFNAFFMELHKDGEPRPVMSEFYNWYGRTPAHDVRGFAQHLVHGECFYNFAFHHIFGQPANYDLWSWDPARWDLARGLFQKARALREYLAVPASAANVALLLSDLTPVALAPIGQTGGSLDPRWFQHQNALFTALGQSQIPADVIWTATLTPEKLARYRVLVMMENKLLTPAEGKLLTDWVTAGGTLIVSGTTSLYDPWGRQQADYSLAALFGVNYASAGGITDPEQSDTWGWRQSGPTTRKLVTSADPEEFRHHVHRSLKPAKGLATYKLEAGPELAPLGLAAGTACDYDLPLGYDVVKPGTATVLARFANGDPALTVNHVGKGLCYFWAPICPGLGHVASDWEMAPNRLDFWPNVRELFAAMVKGGLAQQGAALPVEVTGVPTALEVTVRQQPGRWLVHLLNYDPRLDQVKAPRLVVHPPAGRLVKRLFYPDTKTDVAGTPGANGTVAAQLRDVAIHDLLVIEWAP